MEDPPIHQRQDSWRGRLHRQDVWRDLCRPGLNAPYKRKGGPLNPFAADPSHNMAWRRRVVGPVRRLMYSARLRTTDGLCLPDFLGIGAQKAGTTWLWKNLNQHPRLALARPKELHYFSFHDWAPLENYSDILDRALRKKAPTAQRVGEISPVYASMPPKRIRFLRRLMPRVKVVLLLRHPIDRIWSAARMQLVRRKRQSPADIPLEAWLEHVDSAGCVARTDYVSMLKNWLAVFPPEQIFVGSFEQLTQQPADLLSRVFRFLKVTDLSRSIAGEGSSRVFAGPPAEMPPALYEHLARRYRPMVERLAEMEPTIAEPWLATFDEPASTPDAKTEEPASHEPKAGEPETRPQAAEKPETAWSTP
ncbi:MAG: sulfotransferase [Planctomycetota bacterium]